MLAGSGASWVWGGCVQTGFTTFLNVELTVNPESTRLKSHVEQLFPVDRQISLRHSVGHDSFFQAATLEADQG